MWSLYPATDIQSYVVFVLASMILLLYTMAVFLMTLSVVACKLYMHKSAGAGELGDIVPGVSIIKPITGVDSFVEHNLETHFRLNYPQFELLICCRDQDEAVISLVNKLHMLYPDVDVKLFVGTGNRIDIVNPMVQNMLPAYEAAKYEYLWISSSRIEASTEILLDMVSKLQKSNVALVHQMPFTTNSSGFGSHVEKIYFGAAMARFYISLNVLGLCCVTGMSYMFKKSLLDQGQGLAWYGRYLAEDFFLTRALHDRGQIIMSALPAKQNVGPTSVRDFVDRMVRWVRLRLNMMTVVTGLVEPLSDCFPLGLLTSCACYYLWEVNPWVFCVGHVSCWVISDYILLSSVQDSALPMSKLEYLLAWTVRELTATYIFLLAVVNPHYITWGPHSFHVKLGGLTQFVPTRTKTQNL